MTDSALEPGAGEGQEDPRAALGRHLRGLFDGCGLSLRQFTRKHGFSHSAIARYLSGERLPRKAFLDALLSERGTDTAPVTGEVRRLTFALYRAALEAGGSAVLMELYELEVRLDDLLAELAQVHAEAHERERRRARGEASAGAPEQDLPGEDTALLNRRAVLLAELDRVRHEITRREAAPSAPDVDPSPALPPLPGGTPPLPPGDTSVPAGGRPGGPGSKVPWVVAGVAVLTAAVFFGMWLGRPSGEAAGPAPGTDSGSEGSSPARPRTSAASGTGDGDEPRALASTRTVIPRGEAVDADSRYATMWDTGYEWGDFEVSDDPVRDSVFTGGKHASLTLSEAADWETCGAGGVENASVPASSLRAGTTLCGITSEGNRSALTVETVRTDARGVLSVTVRFTTWNTA
ncbi:helix-turn-helix transcriptional regulator [Streptomyces sp. JJ36]|uniref:helix-turn-helix domain-containing protein n=1 Tax=Streptomyces sp. JJ36 TaxID=2736645 RepID=UPI001F2E8276|nr:helix-turn-helix transcriptional regulator [Streptomyces sp. JJ36]MCF6524831.1 helix-turn-helix domain-containing protein [Streptomyces sp. JJ36]